MAINNQHCSFVLLAEFDIDTGAQLTYQFPQPLGTDEVLVAHLMLPDGAEKHPEDWTIFFLNQTPFNTISPVLALETDEIDNEKGTASSDRPELLYVLSLVRTKRDNSVRRGAIVRAMAICTRHPYIQIFKPVLLMALDDYFNDPSQDCLTRLFDAINSMDLSPAPVLSRCEKIVMRNSERKDVFAEKFVQIKGESTLTPANWTMAGPAKGGHRHTNSNDSGSSLDDLPKKRELERNGDVHRDWPRPRERDRPVTQNGSNGTHVHQAYPSQGQQQSPSDSSFSLGESAVWVGDESGLESSIGVALGSPTVSTAPSLGGSTAVSTTRARRSTDASGSSTSSSSGPGKEYSVNSHNSHGAVYTDGPLRIGVVKDTHFFQTLIAYKGHQLPIMLPLSTFPEEVGDYSLIQLVQTFSAPSVVVSGPLHPHLHLNGNMTHPIMLLFNGLLTGKRILFLGHGRPAGQLANYVLSACALGSGCGAVLRGFVERAFPHAPLESKHAWGSIPGYIAGSTNPILESSVGWDLLFDVTSGRVVVSKDIHVNYPPTSSPPPISAVPPLIARTGTLKAEGSGTSEDDLGRLPGKDVNAQKSDFVAKADNADNLFIEDIITAISYHFGESLVRMRFTEYVARFVRLASRYEEDYLGSTKIGFSSYPFSEGVGGRSQLGSGMIFNDEAAGARELAMNASRIEGWRKTNSYQYCVIDFKAAQASSTISGVDIVHQVLRMRHAKTMADAEIDLIVRIFAQNLQSYEQVVELLAHLPPNTGGLLPLSFGLFHQIESIRETTVDIFNELRSYSVGVVFLQALNHFQRYAYVRQAHARQSRLAKDQQQLYPPSAYTSRTPSSRSESSLAYNRPYSAGT